MFRFNWKLTAFTLLLLPLLLSLGYWQLQREQLKIQMQSRYEQRLVQAPLSLDYVDWQETDLGWMRITATGYFEPRQQFLLDNRIFQSRVGYEVLTPFRTDYGTLLVNRGWIAQGVSRQVLPALPVPDERVTINAVVYVPDGELMVLGADDFSGDNWPKVVQRLDVATLADTLGLSLLPYSVRLEENTPGLLQYNWQPVNTRPETHRGYAVQWFIMALVLLILYFMFSFRRTEH